MFQTAVLASGSKGNCFVIQTESTKLLLDAGLSGKKILQALEKIGIDKTGFNALLISHDHHDHISGAGIICRMLNIPLYINESAFLMKRKHLGKLPFKARFFYNEDKFEIGDIRINPFSSSHDSLESSNFIFRKKGLKNKKLAVATDLGFSTRLTIKKLMNSSTIILESNHDEKMLIEGPYPWHLKQRVKGKQGHLSNEQAVGVISRIIHPGLKNLILAHLSEINNSPEIAHSLMQDYLKMVNHDLNLVVSNQYEPTKLVNI